MLACPAVQVAGQAYRYQQFTMREGLPSDYIMDIYFDAKGIMWLGTDKGICRIEGSNVATATTSEGLPNNMVYSVTEDAQHRIWTAGGNGLARLQYAQGRLWADTNVYRGLSLSSITRDSSGGFWITGQEPGDSLFRLWYTPKLSAPLTWICSMKTKNAVAVTSHGEVLYHPGVRLQWNQAFRRRQPIRNGGSALPVGIHAKNGMVGVITSDSLYTYAEGAHDFRYAIALPVVSKGLEGYKLYLGKKWHVLWRGQYGVQLYRPNGRFSRWLGREDANQAIMIFTVAEDPLGNLYFSDFGNGLKADGGNYQRSYLAPSKINRIALFPNGVYANTDRQVIEVRTGMAPVRRYPWGADSAVHFVARGTGNQLWQAAFNQLFDPLGNRVIHDSRYFSDFSDLAVSGDSMFISSYSHGIWVLRAGQKPYPYQPKGITFPRSINRMKCIGNDLLLMSLSDGLTQINLNQRTVMRLSMPNALSHNSVHDVWKQSDTLFIATAAGISIIAPGGLQMLGRQQGFQGKRAIAVFADRLQRIWVLSDTYLHLLYKNKLVPVRSHPVLLSDRSYITTAVYQPEKDILWIGTNTSLEEVSMALVKPDSLNHAMALRELWLGNQPLEMDESHIELKADHEPLRIDMANPYYSIYSKPDVYYQLQGYNSSWQKLEPANSLSFTRLPPGQYTLLVKTEGPDLGSWPPHAMLTIDVLPPFYKRPAFFLALAILGCAAAMLWWRKWMEKRYQQRMKQMQASHALQTERARISRELHDNVGGMLALIINKLEDEESQNHQKQPTALLARHTLGQLRETIWALDRQSITLADWQARADEYLQTIQQDHCQMHSRFNWSNPDMHLSPVEALNMFRIMQEACTNAIKNGGASNISVAGYNDPSRLILEIIDNGKGFDKLNVKTGYGLRNMQKRADEMQAQLVINSQMGEGTRITLNWPLQRRNTPNG
jgi:signal transduction histidine kinase